ncbi:MAG TPA: TonB family protein, partial [Kofleriaceae bacterium]|nr:TonB family protein [Kofleriaceae bacterium]
AVAPVDAAPVVVPPPVDAAPVVAPPVDAAPPDVDADLTAAVSAEEIVRQADHQVVASRGHLDRCYQNATKVLPADQPLRGRVDIGFAVLPTGAVNSVVVLQNTTGSDQLGQCVQAVVESWGFSPHGDADAVHLARTFTF